MKQERIKKSLEWIERLIAKVEAIKKARTTPIYSGTYEEGALQIFRPLRHAARKAVEKPVRRQGNRAFCPDCQNEVRKRDNYCSICGQRLTARQQEQEKPFYAYYTGGQSKRERNGKNGKRK